MLCCVGCELACAYETKLVMVMMGEQQNLQAAESQQGEFQTLLRRAVARVVCVLPQQLQRQGLLVSWLQNAVSSGC